MLVVHNMKSTIRKKGYEKIFPRKKWRGILLVKRKRNYVLRGNWKLWKMKIIKFKFCCPFCACKIYQRVKRGTLLRKFCFFKTKKYRCSFCKINFISWFLHGGQFVVLKKRKEKKRKGEKKQNEFYCVLETS